MNNYHPFFASFPIVILVFLTIFVVFKSKVSYWKDIYIFFVGNLVIFSLFAYYSGFFALDQLKESQIEISIFHQSIARLLLFLSLFIAGLLFSYLSSGNKIILKILDLTIILSLLLALYVGYHGAELVFKHGLGVSL